MNSPVVFPSWQEIDRVAGKTGGLVRSTVMAAKLGVHGRTIRRCFERGCLPGAKEHGPRILVVPTRLLRLAEAYGLRAVERMARAGLLAANPVDLPRRYGKRAGRP